MIKPPARLLFHPGFALLLLLFSSPARTESESYGLLWLDIQPADATVALDDRTLDAHVWLVSVPPGSHDLAIRKSGFKDKDEHFDIESGQSLHLAVQLSTLSTAEEPVSGE